MANTRSGSKPARRYRTRRVQLADGDLLVLHADGRIEHRDPTGIVAQSWLPADPGWPQRAIRFGLREAAETVRPAGRNTLGPKPLA